MRHPTLAVALRARRLFEVVAQQLVATGMTELLERLGLDLADTLAGDLEDVADLFEGAGVAVLEPEAQLEHLPLALG